MKIPKGLYKCEKCGEYRGQVTEVGENIEVFCICDGIQCPKCKKNKIRKPISNHYDEKDGKIWHTPYFLTACEKCRQKEIKIVEADSK